MCPNQPSSKFAVWINVATSLNGGVFDGGEVGPHLLNLVPSRDIGIELLDPVFFFTPLLRFVLSPLALFSPAMFFRCAYSVSLFDRSSHLVQPRQDAVQLFFHGLAIRIRTAMPGVPRLPNKTQNKCAARVFLSRTVRLQDWVFRILLLLLAGKLPLSLP
jgi:hypothetical protein